MTLLQNLNWNKYSNKYRYIQEHNILAVMHHYAHNNYRNPKLFLHALMQEEDIYLLQWAFEKIKLHKTCYPNLDNHAILHKCLCMMIDPRKESDTKTYLQNILL